ncbi:hypothetical protein LXL04_003285 [Taraxacum kok-saghyz]
MWRFITEEPHVINITARTDPSARILGEREEVEHVPTPLDLEKAHTDKQALSKLIFDILRYPSISLRKDQVMDHCE